VEPVRDDHRRGDQADEIIDLDDVVALCRKGEFEAEHFGVGAGLLHGIGGGLVTRLGFVAGKREVTFIPQKVIDALFGGLHTKPFPTGIIRPSVTVRCSAIEWGSLSHPACCKSGTTDLRQVSASFAD
jgi:hypothetical protein